jgi:16S rRNA (guanine527-N7)-methyltransferase
VSLNEFKRILLENNKKFNLISSKDEEIIDVRHIQESAQIIDLIDKKSKKCIDLGSGAGFPGIVISIIMKHNNISTIFDLYEKSPKKSDFLRLISEKLELNT